jgi:uncharacterized protein YPO0396
MKLLTKMKVINWHYFWNETIEFEPIVFLTGLNASGKSTLIDGMQLLLLGDTIGRYFNKAASDKSMRTLKGYLRGELGDIEDGGFDYLRNGRFTSYLAMQFHDDVKERDFTIGCVFDCYDDGSEEHRFFVLEDKIPSNEFIVNKLPLEYKNLVKFFKDNYQGAYKFFDSNRQYSEYLKRLFGGLKDKYFSLIKKAVSFSPITDIETFITEYVCDPQANVDIGPMQENILQYKRLENEALLMQNRIERLEEIDKTYQAYHSHKKRLDLFSYLIEKAELNIENETLQSFISQVENGDNRLKQIAIELKEIDRNTVELDKKKYRLIAERVNSEAYRLTDELQERKEQIIVKMSSLIEEVAKIKDNLKGYCDRYQEICKKIIDILKPIDFTLLEDDKAAELKDLLSLSERVIFESKHLIEKGLADPSKVEVSTLNKWRESVVLFKQQISALSLSLAKTIASLDKKNNLLKQQQGDMEQGGKSYEFALLSIKKELTNQLSSKYGKQINVEIFADLIDINDHRWANAIEGYLFNQKFNLIVEARYYLEAYEILGKLLDKYRYYSTRLVDIESIIKRGFTIDNQSLASEITTDHEGAKAYANYLLGRLIKCQTPSQARESGNGITPETDIYRSFTLGKLHPNTYRTHFIGTRVTPKQLVAKKEELSNNVKLVSQYKMMQNLIGEAHQLEVINSYEINASIATFGRGREIEGLKQTLEYVNSELNKHDLSQIASYDQRIKDIEEDIKNLNEDKESLIDERGRLVNQIEHLNNEKIPEEKRKVNERAKRLDEGYDGFLVSEEGLPLYETLLNKGKTALAIVSEYNTQLGNVQYLVSNIFNQLTSLRREYVRDYRLSFDTQSEINNDYANELLDLRDVKLPEYQTKITDAYSRATKQFKDDFISRLRDAIDTVIDQIEDLNNALKASSFGDDSYQFVVKPSAEYRRYYDMIKDDMLLTIGEDDSAFIEKYDDVMNDLFKQIVDVGSGDINSVVLENVDKFTDYRSYLDFDLIVTNKLGVKQHLSKVIKKKSGGETQTPFYISVLASFAQLYRIHERGDLSNCIRLIIFDEAFSKMDRGRIQESVRLLRKFGLQTILSAPTDKVVDISSLADQTLVVLNDKNASRVHLYAEETKNDNDTTNHS